MNHTSRPERFNELFTQSASFRAAVEHAQRWANTARKQVRIYRQYGVYAAQCPARDQFWGEHETFINPLEHI